MSNELCWPRCHWMDICLWICVIISQITNTGPTKCLKRDEIEERDGNVYYCLDHDLPACCELETSFTCCEEPWKTIVRNQMWIILVVFTLIILLIVLCFCGRGQSEVFEKQTAKQAFLDLKEKIVSKFSRNRPKPKRFDHVSNEFTTPT